MAGVALLTAACGGSGASSSTAGGSTYYQKAVAYAQCMRSHGVPSFPDPDSQGQFPTVRIGRNGVTQQAVQSAQNACRHLQPGGGTGTSQQQQARVTQALDFSRCMRAHGVADFPDPSTSNGGIGYNLSGVDTSSPQYQSAQQACRSQSGKGQSPAGGGS
ncbi:MAG TPA: hypothetical protein VGI05_00545 [Streptosporangiaceae bacterium]|jgi:hypothetical protein